MIRNRKVARAVQELDRAAERVADTLSSIYRRRRVLTVVRDLIGSTVEDYLEQVEYAVREDDLSMLNKAASELQDDARHINRVIDQAVRDYSDFDDIHQVLRRFALAVSTLLTQMNDDVYDSAREVIYDETSPQELSNTMLWPLNQAIKAFNKTAEDLASSIKKYK